MRVRVDPDLCEANERCVHAAPQVFALGDADTAQVKVDDVPQDQQALVERAIRLCPRQAISWAQE